MGVWEATLSAEAGTAGFIDRYFSGPGTVAPDAESEVPEYPLILPFID